MSSPSVPKDSLSEISLELQKLESTQRQVNALAQDVAAVLLDLEQKVSENDQVFAEQRRWLEFQSALKREHEMRNTKTDSQTRQDDEPTPSEQDSVAKQEELDQLQKEVHELKWKLQDAEAEKDLASKSLAEAKEIIEKLQAQIQSLELSMSSASAAQESPEQSQPPQNQEITTPASAQPKETEISSTNEEEKTLDAPSAFSFFGLSWSSTISAVILASIFIACERAIEAYLMPALPQ